MTPEEINKAIAEVCGYVYEVRKSYRDTPGWYKGNVLHYDGPPNFWEDLNACAEMERTMDEAEKEIYAEFLETITKAEVYNPADIVAYPEVFKCAHATAPQRCEAFLRTKGLWR